MKLIGLCPTYGRRRSLLEETLQNFVHQDHTDKELLLFDDTGILENTRCCVPGVRIMSTNVRQPSIGAKYNTMIQWLDDNEVRWDGVVVVDDDDVYNPRHWSLHAEVLADHRWSKPSRIVSAYFTPPKEEDATGRFHGSIAVRRDLIAKAPWIDTTRSTFDQEYLALLNRFCAPGDPCEFGPPQYVYRWQTSGGSHCSGLMGSPTWYADYQPDSREPITELAVDLPQGNSR